MRGAKRSWIGGRAVIALMGLGAAVLGGTAEAPAATAASYFLAIAGIPGESTDHRYRDQIDVMSFSLDLARRNSCGDFKVIKYIDKASPKLMLSAVLGTIHPTAVLSGVTAGLEAGEFMKLTLVSAMVTAVNLSDTAGSPPAIETVTFSAERIDVEYRGQNQDGTWGQPLQATIPCGVSESGRAIGR